MLTSSRSTWSWPAILFLIRICYDKIVTLQIARETSPRRRYRSISRKDDGHANSSNVTFVKLRRRVEFRILFGNGLACNFKWNFYPTERVRYGDNNNNDYYLKIIML